jgi:dethiobiotin synthetase
LFARWAPTGRKLPDPPLSPPPVEPVPASVPEPEPEPELVVPERSVAGPSPADTEPVAAPDPATPVGGQPVMAEPVEAQPVEAQPVEAQPVEAQPVEAQPVEAEPAGAEPVEAQSVEARPAAAIVVADTVAADPAVADTKPRDADPGDAAPAEDQLAEPEPLADSASPAEAEWPAGPSAAGPGPAAPPGAEQDSRPAAPAAGQDDTALSARTVSRAPEVGEWRGIVLVTGTDTDVGKTIVTSAIAASALAAGLRVAVVKPGQTGTAGGGPTDIDLVNRLAGPHTARTLASYPDPLAPLAAAKVAELPPLELYEVVDAVRAEAEKHDLVLVEGAGGLLVPMGVRPSGDPWTFADLAVTLGVPMIVVTRAGLGTLNHTALTLEALERRGIPAGVVLGAWPNEPELVHWANLGELVPYLVGALPDGAGSMDPGVFRRSAPGWLTPALYGVLDNWRVWAEEVS